jgi:hypothetical protein
VPSPRGPTALATSRPSAKFVRVERSWSPSPQPNRPIRLRILGTRLDGHDLDDLCLGWHGIIAVPASVHLGYRRSHDGLPEHPADLGQQSLEGFGRAALSVRHVRAVRHCVTMVTG